MVNIFWISINISKSRVFLLAFNYQLLGVTKRKRFTTCTFSLIIRWLFYFYGRNRSHEDQNQGNLWKEINFEDISYRKHIHIVDFLNTSAGICFEIKTLNLKALKRLDVSLQVVTYELWVLTLWSHLIQDWVALFHSFSNISFFLLSFNSL